jgi:uncharacterized protein (UPF0371 family)
MTKRSGEKMVDKKGKSKMSVDVGANEENVENGGNGKGVLKTIVRQAKKREAKQQELFLKYIDVFSDFGKEDEDEEVIYDVEFVDDEEEENTKDEDDKEEGD